MTTLLAATKFIPKPPALVEIKYNLNEEVIPILYRIIVTEFSDEFQNPSLKC